MGLRHKERTPFIEKHLRDVLWRAPVHDPQPKRKRVLDATSPDPVKGKVPKTGAAKTAAADAYKAWASLDPLSGKDIYRNWAIGRGECAKGQNTCKRPHAYPANTPPAVQQSFKEWVKARPN